MAKIFWVAAVLGAVLGASRGDGSVPLRLGLGVAHELQGVLVTDSVQHVDVEVLSPLPPSSAFEVRVSYLATQPANFAFRLLGADAASRVHGELRRRRRLNTERFRLHSDAEGALVLDDGGPAGDPAVLRVTVTRTGVRPPRAGKGEDLRFNLALETLYVGESLPESSLRMVAWGLACLAAAYFCLAPYISSLLQFPDRDKERAAKN